MKYLSLDLETTGLTPDPDHILMVSMVVEDTDHLEVPVEELPHFTCFVKQREPIRGDLYALAMNGWILDVLSKRTKDPKYPIYTAYPAYTKALPDGDNLHWVPNAVQFMRTHFGNDRITVAGKNVAGFDIPFLPKEIRSHFRHKVLDPGTLYVNWNMDNQAPNFETCLERAGMKPVVSHDAREDAMDVIRLIRYKIKESSK